MTPPFAPADGTAQPAGTETPWLLRGHNALLIVGALWLEYVILSMIWGWSHFATLGFRDPDDAMRLVQVRDFLAGQSWFDVSQHRVNPPVGGPMHWSRLVDMPVAAIIVALRPLVGTALGEIIACLAVPMATLAVIAFGLYRAMRDFIGVHRALLCVALLMACFPILVQVTPLRIDHHAWQIAMATVLLLGLLHADPRKGGLIMGGAMALWLHISSEGLPYAALAGAVLGALYALRPAQWPRILGYVGVLAAGSAALLLVTHGWRASLVSYCDSMSPVYIVPLALVFPLMAIGRQIAGDATILRRAAPVAIAGGAGAALFLATAGPCVAGPFETLDPLVYSFWYRGVLEGLPIWDQDWQTRGVMLVPSLFGMAGFLLAARAEQDSDRRILWHCLLALAAGSILVALLVMRAMSVAHLFALPGLAWIIARLYPRIAALPHMASRVLLTSALCLLSPAGLSIAGFLGGAAISGKSLSEKSTDPGLQSCNDVAQMAALQAVPTATLFAPIDIGPAVLQRTGHSVIGTAHHRNVAGLGKVIHAFLASPDKARAIVTSTSARYLLFCPALNEVQRYRRTEPDGLGARLLAHRPPDWLTPVPVKGMTAMQLYEIKR